MNSICPDFTDTIDNIKLLLFLMFVVNIISLVIWASMAHRLNTTDIRYTTDVKDEHCLHGKPWDDCPDCCH